MLKVSALFFFFLPIASSGWYCHSKCSKQGFHGSLCIDFNVCWIFVLMRQTSSKLSWTIKPQKLEKKNKKSMITAICCSQINICFILQWYAFIFFKWGEKWFKLFWQPQMVQGAGASPRCLRAKGGRYPELCQSVTGHVKIKIIEPQRACAD